MIPENNHWYYPDGKPCYEVPYADPSKGMRSANLSDARKLGLLPGYTKVVAVKANYAIQEARKKLLVKSCRRLQPHEGETDEEYFERVHEDSGEEWKRLREQGKELHYSVFEQHAKGLPVDEKFQKHVQTLTEALHMHGVDLRNGDSETSFASPLGYGGRADNRFEYTVVDLKSKDELTEIDKKGKRKDKQLVYDEHPMQLAAYANGLGIKLNEARCISVFIGVDDAEVRIFEFEQDDIQRGWLMFSLCLGLWQCQNRFGAGK